MKKTTAFSTNKESRKRSHTSASLHIIILRCVYYVKIPLYLVVVPSPSSEDFTTAPSPRVDAATRPPLTVLSFRRRWIFQFIGGFFSQALSEKSRNSSVSAKTRRFLFIKRCLLQFHLNLRETQSCCRIKRKCYRYFLGIG